MANKLFGVCLFILVVEMCERLCFYTLYPTFPEYLVHAGPHGEGMQQGPANALKQSFRMLAYVFPVVGGYLADNVYGRYRTILYFTICYVVGVAMIAVGALPSLMTSGSGKIIFIIGAFVFTAVGTGAIKPNVVNFGAEQYDESDPIEVEQQKSFFSYFYLTINIGSVFSSVWIAGLATSTTTPSGPGLGYFEAYTVAAVAMALSLMAFIIGTPFYSPESKAIPTRKPMVSIVRKHLFAGAGSSWQGKLSLLGFFLIPIYLAISLISSLLPSSVKIPSLFHTPDVPGLNIISLIAMLMALVSSGALIMAHRNNDWIPEIQDTRVGAITTEEVRGFMRSLPTIVCVTIGFNICYGGMDIYQIQACQMDTQTGFPDWLNSFFFLEGGQFNGVFFSLGNNASIIVCIPLFEKVIFPCLKSMRRGRPVSRKMKFNAGFFFAILGCVIGMIIEALRKHADLVPCPSDLSPSEQVSKCFCISGADREPNKIGVDSATCQALTDGLWLLVPQCAPKGVPMSSISAWWTFIPYWVTGMGEILVNPVIQEFAFDEVSASLKSLLMGVTMVVMGCIPSVISGGLAGFIPNNLNKGNVDVVFIVFIVLSVILLGVYHLIAIPDKVRNVGDPALMEQDA